jgi:hypothetical protein
MWGTLTYESKAGDLLGHADVHTHLRRWVRDADNERGWERLRKIYDARDVERWHRPTNGLDLDDMDECVHACIHRADYVHLRT